MTDRGYDMQFATNHLPFGAYGQSNTANVLFAVAATRRWAQDGIGGVAPLCPGSRQRRPALGRLARVDRHRVDANGHHPARVILGHPRAG
jgi:hypothetical protein